MRGQVRIICDPETGEKIDELNTGDKIVRAKTQEYLKSTVEILPNATYIKTYLRPLAMLSESLTGPETYMVYYLLQYLSYESGILVHQNGRTLSREYITEETGQSERQVDRTIERLKEKEVLKKVVGAGRQVCFLMNPWLFMRGKRINKTLYELFKNSRWAKVHEIKTMKDN